ncbi:MAG: hypothetical protein NTX86_00635 [Candidatus Dependentiae bacterium]|nr:hypothetical protein [Candidatus Dependentiae bacterium]
MNKQTLALIVALTVFGTQAICADDVVITTPETEVVVPVDATPAELVEATPAEPTEEEMKKMLEDFFKELEKQQQEEEKAAKKTTEETQPAA